MVLPNYKGGSTLNLISSIGKNFGYKSKHPPLKILNPLELKNSKNIVFILADGLGYEFLRNTGKNSILNKYNTGKITTSFPSSTSSAIPMLQTASSPQEHGMTGWYMFLKELQSVIIPLPYVLRSKEKFSFDKVEDIKKIFNIEPFFDKIKVKSYFVQKEEIIDSGFTKSVGGKAKKFAYKTTKEFFKNIEKAVKSNSQKKYVFAYWSDHDSLCHKYGTTHKKVLKNFKDFDKLFGFFLKSVNKTNTTVIVTADHGEIDVPKSKRINLKDHPKLRETLSISLCGEHRFAYCYVKPSKEKQFKNYVKTKLKYCCNLYKSEDLFKKGLFGSGKPHKEFLNRIGDYVIIMKEDYGIYDQIPNSKAYFNLGDHGGLSKEEMYVPLIVVKV
ncbi:MAG: alkaline phosphatase family protein [Nanoarchaeota archaeon]